MPKVSYVVDLSDKERVKLLNIVNKGKATANEFFTLISFWLQTLIIQTKPVLRLLQSAFMCTGKQSRQFGKPMLLRVWKQRSIERNEQSHPLILNLQVMSKPGSLRSVAAIHLQGLSGGLYVWLQRKQSSWRLFQLFLIRRWAGS